MRITKTCYDRQRFNEFDFNEINITKILKKLQINKACCPDRIETTVLKNLPSFYKSFLLIFKTALNKSFFRSSWNINEVIPIFKDDNRAMNEQYRVISFSRSISEVFEKVIVQKQLDQSHLEFSRHQSVVTQLQLFLDLLHKEHNEKENALFLTSKKLLIFFHPTCCSNK